MDLAIAEDVGERVAKAILEKGKPVLVSDTARAHLPPAPAERRYKTASFISYPITLGERGIAIMNYTDKVGGEPFDKRDLDLLDSIAPQVAVVVDRMALREKAGEYAQLSITDPLTGLLNRRYIEERLTEEINRSDRTGEPVSFMMLDVDEFKSYNDRYGHPAGDEALEMIGQVLRENLRGADVAARYGGEEFSVLLPETNTEEAQAIAERIRKHVEDTKFPKRRVTVSIGIASLGGELTEVKALVKAADDALYRAKCGAGIIYRFTATRPSTAANKFTRPMVTQNGKKLMSALPAGEFFGRTAELDRVLRHSSGRGGLRILSPPWGGAVRAAAAGV